MNSRIKLSARAALSGSYIMIVPIVAAIMILVFGFSVCNASINRLPYYIGEYTLLIFAAVSLLAAVAAIGPLRLLLQIRFLLLARGRNSVIKPDIGFSGMLRACELCVRLFFAKLFWLVAFEFIPAAGLFVFISRVADEAISLRAAYAVVIGIFVLAAAGLIFYFMFTQRYSKSMFYLACYKDFTAGDAIRESIKKTKDKQGEILLFKLSFAPWFLLCLGVIPALFVIPYYKQSVTCLFLSR